MSGVTADDEGLRNIIHGGNVIVAKNAGVITLTSNQLDLAPTPTANATGNVLGFMGGGSGGIFTRLALYGTTQPTNADLHTYLGHQGGRNIIRASNNPGVSPWILFNATFTPNVAANPLNGLTNMTFFSIGAGSVQHAIYQPFAARAKPYIFSGYFKKPTSSAHRYWALCLSDGVAVNYFYGFDTDNWVSHFATAGVTGGIIGPDSNGWYRVWMKYTYTSAFGSANCQVDAMTAGGSVTVNAPGLGVWYGNLQLHPGQNALPESYRPKVLFTQPAYSEQ